MFGPDGPSLLDLTLQGLSSTRAGYDRLAPRFDATPFRTPDEVLERVAAHVARGVRPARVLDLCCGTGAVLSHLEPHCDALTGLDFSPGMLEVARARLPRARFLEADVLTWEPDGTYDLITCFGAFGHVVEVEQPAFLGRVRRALIPGGRFLFVTGPTPPLSRPVWWAARGFNAVMRVRNAVLKPPFIMYYLTFSLPEALERIREAGMESTTTPLGWDRRPELLIVEAYRAPGSAAV